MSTEVDDLLFRLLTPVAKLYTAKQVTFFVFFLKIELSVK